MSEDILLIPIMFLSVSVGWLLGLLIIFIILELGDLLRWLDDKLPRRKKPIPAVVKDFLSLGMKEQQ